MILTIPTMSRSKEYQKLLNDKRWKYLRRSYLQAHPLCEICEQKGYYVSAVDIHHKIPVESAKTTERMEELCYSWTNLQALCIPCHVLVHKKMGKDTRENRKQRKDDALQRWIERHRGDKPDS